MEYDLKIKQASINVKTKLQDRAEFGADLGDKKFKVQYDRVSKHLLHICVNGQNINAWVDRQKDGKTIVIKGERFFVQDNDHLVRTKTRKSGIANEPFEVTPPMPAVVILVPVNLGDWVAKGDRVVVISAMKMETALTAPHGGIITRIGVAEGDKVMPGEILMDIEESEKKSGGSDD